MIEENYGIGRALEFMVKLLGIPLVEITRNIISVAVIILSIFVLYMFYKVIRRR